MSASKNVVDGSLAGLFDATYDLFQHEDNPVGEARVGLLGVGVDAGQASQVRRASAV